MNPLIHVDHVEIFVGDDLGEVLTAIGKLREELMAKYTDVVALLGAMNDVTNDLAANVDIVIRNEEQQVSEIQRLRDLIASGSPVTQDQLEDLATTMSARVAALGTVRDHLRTIATNPEDPAPTPPPIEEGNGEVHGDEGTGTGAPGDEGGAVTGVGNEV